MKKEIFWARDGRPYGPDVISLPEFCALNRWIYDTRGQIDMNPAIAAALIEAFAKKKLFVMGPVGVRTDGGIPPVIAAIWDWVNFHLNPKARISDIEDVKQILVGAGFKIYDWEVLYE